MHKLGTDAAVQGHPLAHNAVFPDSLYQGVFELAATAKMSINVASNIYTMNFGENHWMQKQQQQQQKTFVYNNSTGRL